LARIREQPAAAASTSQSAGEVRGLDGDEDQQQRGGVPFAGLDDGEVPTVVVMHRWNASSE